MRLLAALIALGLMNRPILAQQPKSAKQEELKDLVARRIERATGKRTRIPYLAYNVFSSTFLGKEIELGPEKRPLVRVPRLEVEMVLLSDEPGSTVARINVREPRVVLPASWLLQPFRYPVYRPVTVRTATVSDGLITIRHAKGTFHLEGVRLSVNGLHVPVTPAARAPKLRGALTLTARRVAVADDFALRSLAARGSLADGRLVLENLAAMGPAGQMRLKGTIGLGGRRGIGPVDLSGEVSLGWGKAMVRLRGRSLAKLQASGRIVSLAKTLPRRGGLTGAPPLNVRLRAGKRWLRGSLQRWRLR